MTETFMRLTRRLHTCIGIGALCALAPACESTYAAESEALGVTSVLFDDRLPRAIEEVFQTCHPEFAIWWDDEELDLRGECVDKDPDDMPSSESGVLLLGLLSEDPIELEIPEELYDERSTFSGFPVPAQNCYVIWDTEIYFRAISFQSLSVSWTEHDGEAALWFSLTNPVANWGPATYSTIADARCPSPINEGIIQGKLDNSGFNGSGTVEASDIDLDIFVHLTPLAESESEEETDNLIVAKTVVELHVGDIGLSGIDWKKLPNTAASEGQDALEENRAILEEEGGKLLEPLLADLNETIEDQISSVVDDGHVVCSIDIAGDKLRIIHDVEDEENSCTFDTSGCNCGGGGQSPDASLGLFLLCVIGVIVRRSYRP